VGPSRRCSPLEQPLGDHVRSSPRRGGAVRAQGRGRPVADGPQLPAMQYASSTSDPPGCRPITHGATPYDNTSVTVGMRIVAPCCGPALAPQLGGEVASLVPALLTFRASLATLDCHGVLVLQPAAAART
jgi:hypothetical protein